MWVVEDSDTKGSIEIEEWEQRVKDEDEEL